MVAAPPVDDGDRQDFDGDHGQKVATQITIHKLNNYFPEENVKVKVGIYEGQKLLIDEVK